MTWNTVTEDMFMGGLGSKEVFFITHTLNDPFLSKYCFQIENSKYPKSYISSCIPLIMITWGEMSCGLTIDHL